MLQKVSFAEMSSYRLSMSVFILTLLLGCATPKSTFEQGELAGEARVRSNLNTDAMAAWGTNWMEEAIALERELAAATAQSKFAKAAESRNPQQAATLAYQAGLEYANVVAGWDAVERGERAIIGSYRQASAEILAAYDAMIRMSRDQDAARADFQRRAATAGLSAAIGVGDLFSQREARLKAEAEAKAARKRQEEAERALQERLNALEHMMHGGGTAAN
jgi:hypothetical protein